MKKLLQILSKKNEAKLNLLLILTLIFGVAFGCNLNSSDKSDTDEKKTEKTNDDEEDEEKEDKKPEKADASTGEVPSDEALQGLVKETMLDFNDAITKGDFSDFYDNISETWQKQIKPKDLDKGFDVFIKNDANFSEIRKMEAEFDPKPRVKKRRGMNVLDVEGSYDTSPRKVSFELEYIPEDDEWKLIAIRVRAK